MASNSAILVTGATGFIGRRLVEHLRGSGCNVTGWTRAHGDLRDAAAVRSVLDDLRPEKVFHLASPPPGATAEDWSRVAGEQLMLGNLAYAMPRHATLVYAGSMAEYGRSGVLREQDQCTPDTAYGCAKFAGTSLAVSLRTAPGLDVRAARVFGVYGPGEGRTRLLPALIEKLRAGDIVPLSDGMQSRDFIHIDDVCTALIALSAVPRKNAPAIVNIGTGLGVQVADVCRTVADILGADPALLHFGALPRRAVDQDCLIADTELMRAVVEPPPQRWLDHTAAGLVIEQMTVTATSDHSEKSL